ncbi:MAG: ABC transporter permease [Peptostreptococcaceae bacterium]|nr:ABC transporter permease [Peptostreptococcaceae bacterium]
MSQYKYSDQNLGFSNLPPRFEIYSIDENTYVYVHKEYKLYAVSRNGEFLERIEPISENAVGKSKEYSIGEKNVVLDYSNPVNDTTLFSAEKKFILTADGQEVKPLTKVFNKTYWFGSDASGRDIFVRVLSGARISLLIAFVATAVNLIIGVSYGFISGLAGGRIDEAMMRFVDILSTIPLILYVILLTVVIGSGIKSIILAIGLVYWVGMARIARGQILSLKKRDYVLAARISGAGPLRIMTRHIFPNAAGPIVAAMTMMIPGAIFTEAFLSFIGLGVSPPAASWGTLANDAMEGMRLYGYELFFPSMAICITILAFNFLGDGLRDALDPKTRR